MEQGVPVPCRRCGAAMEEANSADLYNEVRMRCGFCGDTETLPADQGERVLSLRRRLAQLRWSQQNSEAAAVAIATAIEQYKFVALPMVVIVCALSCLVQLPAAFEGPFDASRVLTSSLGPLISFSVMAAVFGGSLLGLIGYRREMRPAFLAFPPSRSGARMRCRVCGGDLPAGPSGAFVPCRYCSAPNLVTAQIATRRAEDLARELEVHRARAAGVAARLDLAQQRMLRMSYLGFAVGMGGAILLSSLGYVLLVALQEG